MSRWTGSWITALALIAGSATAAPPGAREPVVISRHRIEELRQAFSKVYGTEPGAGEVKAMIEQETEDELLYREARYLGMKEPRKRLIERMRILLSESGSPEKISKSELRAYYLGHREEFRTPPAITFRQVFLRKQSSRIKSVGALLKTRKLAETKLASLSDPFPLGLEIHAASPESLERRFGASFARSVLRLKPGRWHGPIASSYGTHFVRIERSAREHFAPLSAVRMTLIQAISREYQAAAFQRALSRLRTLYSIRVEN